MRSAESASASAIGADGADEAAADASPADGESQLRLLPTEMRAALVCDALAADDEEAECGGLADGPPLLSRCRLPP